MEISASSRPPERENPSPTTSPHSNGNGPSPHPTPTPTPPHTPTPHPISRSHDYPTTFVQADTATFKQVVQMLTGSSDAATKTDPSAARAGIPPIKSTGQKKQGFKLYERRNSLKSGLMQINTLTAARKPEILSPSILDFPALALMSPATPLIEDTLSKPSAEEERAIAEKKFYFHPSPRTGDAQPQLLPLFPVTSPRAS